MKNNLMDEAALAALLRRVEKLQPQSKALWGSMSVSGMMNHCNKIHRSILAGTAPDQRPRMKQRILKTVALSLMRRLPKGVKTPAKTTLPDADDSLSFKDEKTALVEILNGLHSRNEPLHQLHPLFGKLTSREWGRFIWMHTDHHLRQFGA